MSNKQTLSKKELYKMERSLIKVVKNWNVEDRYTAGAIDGVRLAIQEIAMKLEGGTHD